MPWSAWATFSLFFNNKVLGNIGIKQYSGVFVGPISSWA